MKKIVYRAAYIVLGFILTLLVLTTLGCPIRSTPQKPQDALYEVIIPYQGVRRHICR